MEENNNTVQEERPAKKGGLINPKVFIIGLPLFIIQLVAVYFIAVNFLVAKHENKEQPKEKGKTEHADSKTKEPKKDENYEVGKFVYPLEDIIVNPAGTGGKALILTSLSFDLLSEKELAQIKDKEPILKDLVIGVLSNKTLSQLNQIGYKDSLKTELMAKMKSRFKDVTVKNVYFSKYIIQ